MKGKICLITGATSGIGKETARKLAIKGATVVIACRNAEKGEKVTQEISSISGNPNIEYLLCNLHSFHSISGFTKLFKKKYPQLHVLINNAGIWETRRRLSEDGIELTLATNHLAPFLLTLQFTDLLKKSVPARIINVASDAHFWGTMNFNDLEGRKKFSGMKIYAQSKLANVLFTKKLALLLKDTGITVNCLHPGVVATHLFDKMDTITKAFFKMMMISPVKGSETPFYLACSPEVENITGKYFVKKKIKKPSRESENTVMADKLWNISEKYLANAGFIQIFK